MASFDIPPEVAREMCTSSLTHMGKGNGDVVKSLDELGNRDINQTLHAE